MLEKSFSLLFYVRKPQVEGTSEGILYLRITVNSQRLDVSLKRMWDKGRWDVRASRASGTKEDAKSLNRFLDTIAYKANEARRYLIDEGKEVTPIAVRNVMMGISDSKKILDVFADHNKDMAALIGKEYRAGTLDLFERTLLHAQRFIKWKYDAQDLDIRKLDYEFISQFSFYLKTVRNNQHNTTIKYLTYFKKIVLLCVKNDWLDKDPFVNFKLSKREVEKEYLTQTELDVMLKKKFLTSRLTQVRDIFVFSCYTGLAYIDVAKLQRSEITKGDDGDWWITTYRQKTTTPTRVPLLPIPLQLIDKYKNHEQCKIKGLVLPILTNQKMNSYLKEIADACKIMKNLSFHTARHTFATTVTLNNGVPMETVAKMLGHKNLRQTQHYAKLLDWKVSQDMKELKVKLAKK